MNDGQPALPSRLWLPLMLGVLVGCRGAPASTPAEAVEVLPLASSITLPGSGLPPREPEPEAELLPLHAPEHWKRVADPDPAMMGPSVPCGEKPRWSPGKVEPGYVPRSAGKMCSDVKPLVFPVCTEEQMTKAVRLDAVLKGMAVGGVPESDETGAEIYWSFRGYLRRYISFHPKKESFQTGWQIQLRSFDPKTGCSSLSANIGKHLCLGDDSVACCRSSLIESDSEVVMEIGIRTGVQICVVPGQRKPVGTRVFLANEEK